MVLRSVLQESVRNIAIQSIDGAISCEFTRDVLGQIEFIGFQGLENTTFDYEKSVTSPGYHLYLSWGIPYEGKNVRCV